MRKTGAIDQGTTSTRALVVDAQGAGRIVCSVSHQQYCPQPGRVEHDPEELVRNILRCAEACGNVASLGIDNQGESCLAWNSQTKEAVSPVIVWQDSRTADFLEQLQRDGCAPIIREKTGLPLDSYFSAAKLGWICRNLPEAKRLQNRGLLRLGTTDAFFLDRLTGRCVTDVTTASRTSLMNIHTCQWDEELCRLFGVPVEVLPEIVPTVGDFGAVALKERTVSVTASVVDQQAALYGHGCSKAGEAKITFGTGAFALVVTKGLHLSSSSGLLPTVAWQLRGEKPVYALEGGVYAAGAAVEWGRSMGFFDDFTAINSFDRPAAIKRGMAFVPAFTGLGCPHWERSAGGLWLGFSVDTDKKDAMQAILEGIAFRAAEVVEEIDRATGIRSTLTLDGGVSANPYLCQFFANVLQRPLTVLRAREFTAFGTAYLAAGEDAKPPDFTAEGEKYSPQEDLTLEFKKFKKALQRSREWRN
jgi:glycerol kinase